VTTARSSRRAQARGRSSAVRFAVSMAATGAILAIAAHGADEPQNAAAPEPYPRSAAGPVRLGDALVVSGQPMRVSAFATRDPPARVIAFYESAFRERGLVPLSRSAALLGHVSAFGRDGIQRFATALATPRGETLVLVGTADPRRAPRFRAASRDAPYPLPEASRAFVAYASDDGGVHADAGQFVARSPPGEVVAFYRDRLGREGYRETSPAPADRFAAFARADGDLVTIAVQPLDADDSAVFVARTRGR
jgi:hypothetical protein